MHRIQKLEIHGFKSFCDRTEILFNEGVTAIVGPNGCGKSNISDAISWVVGEQSAKSLRTDRMEGVIFNGTQARKATSMAEVGLTLSLPDYSNMPEGLDLDPEGFTVGRRLYRSGESEYLLNGRRCRLKDIQALFEGTGLGPNSYALIEQGRIGQILSSKPADRRALIEEAARITLFKSRRYSAEMKLELATQNLLRVQDIVREVARQLNSLKRQAAKARRYGRLREELRGLHRLRLALERRATSGRLEECEARFAAAAELERAVLDELGSAESARAENQEACRRQEELVNRLRDSVASLQLQAERARSTAQSSAAQAAELDVRGEELERERRALEERSALVDRERSRVGELHGGLSEEIAREQQTLEMEQARAEALAAEVRRTEDRIDAVRSFLLNGAGRLSDLRNLEARSQTTLQAIGARADRLRGERESHGRERETLGLRLQELRAQASSCDSTQRDVAARHSEAEARAAHLDERLERASTELAALQEEHSLMQHRYSSLEEIEARRSNYSEGVQKFLSTQLPGEEPRSSQTLADHVETDPRFETAVEDYLNDPLQYILVDALEDAVSGVERLRRIGAGRCTFLTLRNGKNGNGRSRPALSGEGVIGYLDDLLRMRDDVKHAFERALPEYAATVMVSDLDTAFRVAQTSPGTNFLTMQGEAYSTRGMLSAVGGHKSMAGFLALKREMRELSVRLRAVRGKIDFAREDQARLKVEQTAEAEAIRSFAERLRKLEVEAVGVCYELARAESEAARLETADGVAEQELAQLERERVEHQAKLEQSSAGILVVEDRSRSGEEELQDLGARLESLRAESGALQRVLSELISVHAARKERKANVEAELERLTSEARHSAARLESNTAERENTRARTSALRQSEREAQAEIVRLAGEIETSEQMLANRQRELAADRRRLEDLDADLRVLHQRREEAMAARGRIEIEKTRLESDLEHVERSALEEFHVPLEELSRDVPEQDWGREIGEVARAYEELRERVENFGAINMRALEEYQELDQRFQFLSGQRADIEKSIADTQKAIAEINRRSIEQFQEAFDRVRANFIEVFQMLFRGGQCDLRLLDEGDVLESGIDIIAQPPGKRLQNVLLLSGGEKALTALALLIAIFRYRPSPFCVLDEVDAPLDDANIHRFTKLISELNRETQFIIITHNKRTMEIARTLYGVTMEEPGVSKILSVDFHASQEALAS
jgi:chromosome segregation protein